jgi:hypothetical protein
MLTVVIQSRRVKWEGHVAPIGDVENAYKIYFENPEEWRQLGRVGVD